jgi:hypothetical protein
MFFILLTPILLTWSIGWAPNNANRWQMGFNLAFKGLNSFLSFSLKDFNLYLLEWQQNQKVPSGADKQPQAGLQDEY